MADVVNDIPDPLVPDQNRAPGPGEPKSLARLRNENVGEVESNTSIGSPVGFYYFGQYTNGQTSLERLSKTQDKLTSGEDYHTPTTAPFLEPEEPHSMDEWSHYRNGTDVPTYDMGDMPTGGKVVCTRLIKSTGLKEWYDNRKLWNKHLNKHLTPYHQIGYYIIFKPFTDLMVKNKYVFRFGKWLAVSRTKDIKAVMENRSRYIPGMLIRYFFESIAYVIGYLKSNIKVL